MSSTLDVLIMAGEEEAANDELVRLSQAPVVSRMLTKEDQQLACFKLAQDVQTKAEVVELIERFSTDLGYKFVVRALRGWSFERCVGR